MHSVPDRFPNRKRQRVTPRAGASLWITDQDLKTRGGPKTLPSQNQFVQSTTKRLLVLILFVGLGATPAVIRGYSKLCIQDLFLVGSGEYMGCWGN